MGRGWQQNCLLSVSEVETALWSHQKAAEPVGACAPGGWGVGKAFHSQPHGKGFCQDDGAQS